MAVEYGDVVKVNFIGKLEDGLIFETTMENEPLTVVVGAKDIIEGLEEALVGMEKDEVKEVTIPPEKAYGFRDPKLFKEFPKALFEQRNIEPIEGIRITTDEGDATIGKVTEETVELDFNHPLAGETLVFEIKVEDIVTKK